MGSQRGPLSASKRAVPIKIRVLDLSDRENFPYTGVEPRWSFTLNLLPKTPIKELCIHTAGHIQQFFDAVVDGTRMEARDKDGHVFHGAETVAEEILNDETIFLIEGALDKPVNAAETRNGSVKKKGKVRERGRLLILQSEAEKVYRTPSTSSRSSSSQSRKRAQSQTKVTPCQNFLAVMQAKQTPKSEPTMVRKLSANTISLGKLPSPEPSHTRPAASPEGLSKGREGASSANVRATTGHKEETSTARSPGTPQPPETSPRLLDSQQVVPDSQHSPSRSSLQPASASRDKLLSAVKPTPDASNPSPEQPRPASRLDTPNLGKLHDSPQTIKTLPSRPDPYDITTVLSDNESRSPKPPSSIMFSSIRRLGSASKRQAPASQPPPPRQPQLTVKTYPPSRTSKSETANDNGTARKMDFDIPITPTKKVTTPAPAMAEEASSPAAPLPSSPTNNVAAAIARGYAKAKRPPVPNFLVIGDSADEIEEDLFRDPPSPPDSILQSFEASLPWSQPPLRATQDPLLGVRPVSARRASVPGVVGATAQQDVVEEGDNDVVDSTAEVRRLIDAAKKTLAAAADNSKFKLKPRAFPSSAISPCNLNSPVKSPPRTAPAALAANNSTGQAAVKRPAVTIVHSSSSEDASERAGEDTLIVKKEQSDDDSWKNLPVAAHPTSSDHGDGDDDKAQKTEVIELSSDSDSSIDPAWLDDYEAELPAIDEPLPADPALQNIDLPAPVTAVQASNIVHTDPIEPNVDEEAPPSAQPDKRKRSMSDEPGSEDEREKKRARRAEKRKAKKALRRAIFLENKVRYEEHRKELALEEARRRALKLELIVSSPAKAKELGVVDAEVDDDSGLDLEILDEDMYVEEVSISLDGDDKNDSVSSKGTDDQPSWRQLSKKPLTLSPESKQDSSKASVDTTYPESSTSEGKQAQQQLQQEYLDSIRPAQKQYHRRPFDDWAALEATLSSGGFDYSPLEVHNRVHLAMVHRGLQALKESSLASSPDAALEANKPEPEEDGTNEVLPFMETSGNRHSTTRHNHHVVKPKQRSNKKEKTIASSHKDLPNIAVGDQSVPRWSRSRAPSPKNTALAPRMASTSTQGKKKSAKGNKPKSRTRRERERIRRKSRANRLSYAKLRDAVHAKNNHQ